MQWKRLKKADGALEAAEKKLDGALESDGKKADVAHQELCKWSERKERNIWQKNIL